MDSGNVVSWVQALLFLSAELFLNGVMRFVADRWKAPEWVSQTVVGVSGLILGACYWIRLPAGFAHNPIILVPFVVLTLWLMQDVHSRNKVRLKSRAWRDSRPAPPPSTPAPAPNAALTRGRSRIRSGTENKTENDDPAPQATESNTTIFSDMSGRTGPEKVTPENEHEVALSRPPPLGPSPLGVMVYAGSGMNPRKGVAIIRTLTIEYDRRRGIVSGAYLLECRVEFAGLVPGAEMSPSSLLVTARGGSPRIATMEIDGPPAPQGEKTYKAEILHDTLSPCLTRPGGGSTEARPPQPGTLADVEVRLPRGEALTLHGKSGVALDFELSTGEQFRSFLVRVVDVIPAPMRIDGRAPTLDEVKRARRERMDPVYGIAGVGGLIPNRSEPNAPDWNEIVELDQIELWRAITLSFDRGPETLDGARNGTAALWGGVGTRNEWKYRLDLAESHLGLSLPCVTLRDVDGSKRTSTVRLVDFAKWAMERELPNLPEELKMLAAAQLGPPRHP
jgi:hypothetical protein